MSTCTVYRSIFDFCPDDEALHGIKVVDPILKQTGLPEPSIKADNKNLEDERQRDGGLVLDVSDKMTCSSCRCSFTNREDQMEHYKLDWHRFNLRQKIAGLSPVTVEEFEKKTGAGDMSSISGSESDSDSDSDGECGGVSSNLTGTDNDSSSENTLITGRLSSKVLFQNTAGQYLSVHRCILQGWSDDEQDLAQRLRSVNKKTVWVVLMTGGGHFAGAVFQGKEVIQHKTFHRYTVRAKRGTAQGLRDAQNRSHAPKSAGAALRRYNEAALVKDIQDILTSWADHLKEASAIFMRAPSYNKSIFSGGRTASLDKKDPRVHSIPFATRRATFREVQRVHELLSRFYIYGNDIDMTVLFSPSKKTWKKAAKATVQANTEQEKENSPESPEEEEEGGEIQLEMEELTLTTLDLREYEICPSKRKRRKRKKKDEPKHQNEDLDNAEVPSEEEQEAVAEVEASPETHSKNKKKRKGQKHKEDPVDDAWEYSVRDELFTACKIGDVDILEKHLQRTETAEEDNLSDLKTPIMLLSKPIDSSGFTLLHVASAAAQKAVVKRLLDLGADPAIRDNKGQTPYTVAPDKDTRNVYRRYMGENPDKYDYSKAQIPGPLTAEIESKKSEKKKAQKAQRKRRENDQKEEQRKQETEAEEKRRFAALSDREKRALAAERRLAEQAAATGVSISNVKRCWLCGESILGKIPFQYLEFSFCSPRCVQQHRKNNTKT